MFTAGLQIVNSKLQTLTAGLQIDISKLHTLTAKRKYKMKFRNALMKKEFDLKQFDILYIMKVN